MNGTKGVLDLGPKVWAWVRVGAVAATAAGMWFGMDAKVNAALEEAEDAKTELAKTQIEIKQDLRDIRSALGNVQLDMGQLCAATFGPEKCYTTGRGR